MAQLVLILVAVVAFAAIFLLLQRHPDWSRGEEGTPFSAPGWWKPIVLGFFVFILLFVVYVSIRHGFKPEMLLVFPILGSVVAVGLVLMKVLGRRMRL